VKATYMIFFTALMMLWESYGLQNSCSNLWVSTCRIVCIQI